MGSLEPGRHARGRDEDDGDADRGIPPRPRRRPRPLAGRSAAGQHRRVDRRGPSGADRCWPRLPRARAGRPGAPGCRRWVAVRGRPRRRRRGGRSGQDQGRVDRERRHLRQHPCHRAGSRPRGGPPGVAIRGDHRRPQRRRRLPHLLERRRDSTFRQLGTPDPARRDLRMAGRNALDFHGPGSRRPGRASRGQL